MLLTKLRLGWELEDELGGTRELLQALLAWFQVQKPSLQREALELLHTVVKVPTSNNYNLLQFFLKLEMCVVYLHLIFFSD